MIKKLYYDTRSNNHQDVEVNFVPHREYSASILKTGLLILCMDITVTVSNSTGSVRILHC